MVHPIELAETIEALRKVLETAAKKGFESDIRFPVDGIELGFRVGVTKIGEGSGKISFWVVELGGGGSQATQSLQKVKVTLGRPVKGTIPPLCIGRELLSPEVIRDGGRRELRTRRGDMDRDDRGRCGPLRGARHWGRRSRTPPGLNGDCSACRLSGCYRTTTLHG